MGESLLYFEQYTKCLEATPTVIFDNISMIFVSTKLCLILLKVLQKPINVICHQSFALIYFQLPVQCILLA